MFPAMRIAIALALLTACMLLTADMFGFTPDEDKLALDTRKQIAESLAIQFSVMDPKRDIRKIEGLISIVAKRNPAILSTGIRRDSGQVVFQSPNLFPWLTARESVWTFSCGLNWPVRSSNP